MNWRERERERERGHVSFRTRSIYSYLGVQNDAVPLIKVVDFKKELCLYITFFVFYIFLVLIRKKQKKKREDNVNGTGAVGLIELTIML